MSFSFTVMSPVRALETHTIITSFRRCSSALNTLFRWSTSPSKTARERDEPSTPWASGSAACSPPPASLPRLRFRTLPEVYTDRIPAGCSLRGGLGRGQCSLEQLAHQVQIVELDVSAFGDRANDT